MYARSIAALGAALILTLSPLPCSAELDEQQEDALREIASTVKAAGQLYTQGEYDACGKEIRKGQQQLLALLEEADAEVHAAAQPAIRRMIQAKALLELEGIVIPPLKIPEPTKPEMKKPEPKPPQPEPTEPAPGTPMPSDEVSFTGQVAPLLVQKCGRCHIQNARGEFSMASFARLMQGPPAGVVIFPGDIRASRLIETIETGDMPRGGGSVSPQELEMLKTWVMQGAKFDGPNPGAPLTSYANPAPGSGSMNEEPLAVVQATGEETVSFANDVAPLLIANCNGCHIDAMRVRGGLRMDSFAQLLRGGDSGAVIEPGNAESSLLVQKLRGEVGQRMPLGRPALPPEQIELISTWISEGAKFDGPNPDQNIRTLVALAWAENASDEELSARRAELAAEKWRLGSPQTTPATKTTENFVVMGSLPEERLDEIGRAAEAALEQSDSLVRLPEDAGLRGRVSLFVFSRRYDYSEFGKMIERRSLPGEWREHWGYDGVDAYIALVDEETAEAEELQERLAGMLVAQRVAALGAPRWLSEGLGRATIARLAGRGSDRVREWNAALPTAIQGLKKPDDLMEGRLPPEQADVLAYGIGTFLLDRNNRRGTDALLRALAKGVSVEEAFQAAFRRKPSEIMPAYLTWQQTQRR